MDAIEFLRSANSSCGVSYFLFLRAGAGVRFFLVCKDDQSETSETRPSAGSVSTRMNLLAASEISRLLALGLPLCIQCESAVTWSKDERAPGVR